MFLDKEYRILIVDDAIDTQMLLEFDLGAAGYQTICCDSGEKAIELLETEAITLILLDMYMPGLSGLETLERIKAHSCYETLPVIMLSASNDEDEIVSALELGADDYVTKPYVAKILLARIRTAIRLKEKTEQLEYLAKTDFLTGLNNRGNFFSLSGKAINLANRGKHSLIIAMLDIDFFKSVNDKYGHDVGDKVLCAFSNMMLSLFREYDIIGRIGGEEFAVCLPNTNVSQAHNVCERLRRNIETMDVDVVLEDGSNFVVNITVSIGFVLAEGNVYSVDELLKEADDALYYAKSNGRNQVVDVESIKGLTSVQKTDEKTPWNGEVDMDVEPHPYEGIDFEVGVNNVLGDEELFKEILVMFYQDHHQDAKNLQQALKSNDIEASKHIVHTLKGVSSSVGAMVLFEATKSLDIAINDNNPDKFDALLEIFLPEFERVMKGIAQL